ncbi:MAG: hypothetical protein ACE5DO_02320, partial [Desulfobacterales bacterium]
MDPGVSILAVMKRIIILLLAVLLVACIDVEADNDNTDPDDDFKPPKMTRGLLWVCKNPMFISGLNVSMGEPPARFVRT